MPAWAYSRRLVTRSRSIESDERDVLAAVRLSFDSRMTDALDLLESRRGPDGRWPVNRAYPGLTHVPPEPAGRPADR